jgi:hypothetical protein
VKYREIIADNLKKAGWSLGWVSAMDREGRTLWIVDAHRDAAARIPLNFHMDGNQDQDKP